jgi:small redox-active disulfide protein 2
MLNIKILGSGCANCHRVEQTAKAAAEELGIEATFQEVTQMQDIMKYGIMATPGLVIDEKVVCSGRVPSKAEVTSWLATAAEASPR